MEKSKRPQIIFIGAPGSGKGTQAKNLVESFGYEHISTGDLLRNEVASGSELGQKVKGVLEAGELVTDELVLELLEANCDLDNKFYIFDGFPRNDKQAMLLKYRLLKEKPCLAFYFEINLEELEQRLVNRRTCQDCGAIYNLVSKPPQKEGVCDKCGGTQLTQRKDDNSETVKTRLKVFSDAIGPMVEMYKNDQTLRVIQADKEGSVVFTQIEEHIKIFV